MTKTIEQLRDEATAARNALYEAEKRERDEKNAAIVGKTFKFSNSGGHDGKRWWLYGKVVRVTGGWIEMFEFQTMPDGEINIRPRNKSMQLLGGFDPITKREYDAAWRKVAKRINGF